MGDIIEIYVGRYHARYPYSKEAIALAKQFLDVVAPKQGEG